MMNIIATLSARLRIQAGSLLAAALLLVLCGAALPAKAACSVGACLTAGPRLASVSSTQSALLNPLLGLVDGHRSEPPQLLVGHEHRRQPVRFLHRNRSQHHHVHEAEDGRIRPDAQSERQHRDRREPGTSGEQSDSVAEIVNHDSAEC